MRLGPILLTVIGLAIFGTACLSGCTRDSSNDPRNLTPMVSVEGSDTMSVLLTEWSKQFMTENKQIPVSVTVVDSGGGIKALLEKRTDIAASSRDLTDEENNAVHQKGIHLVRRIVALDSIAVIVNQANTMEEISMDMLRKVFSGTTSNWSDLNPEAEGPITVCIREADSGTGLYFNEHVLQPRLDANNAAAAVSYSKSATVLNSNDSLIDTVAKDKNAIGFIPLSNAVDSKNKVKLLKVKLLESSNAVMPSLQATIDDYSLSRPLYMFFDSKTKESTQKFVDFCLSVKGQEIVKERGFVSLK